MAARKRKSPARSAKAKAEHSGATHTHGEVTVTIGVIGPLKRIKKGKSRQRRKATPKEVKAFLKWALTQL